MNRKNQEKVIQTILVIATLVMTILRFLLNEKGRINPDSIRFMRFANVFPVIENTTTPVGYPASIKFFTLFGFDEFWSSKIVGLLGYLFIIAFAHKAKFYFKEAVLFGGLFSFVSLFASTLSEALFLPCVFFFLYIARKIIIGDYGKINAILYLSLSLILLYNVRYTGLFFMGACFLFGWVFFRKKYSKTFIISGIIGFIFVIVYKFTFIDYFNSAYLQTFLEIGLYPTSKLLNELWQGLFTSFNPFIHIANPAGGIINSAIYGLGFLNIVLMIMLFRRFELTESEKFFVFAGVTGIISSFFIQYFYSVTALDYRLLCGFALPLWMVYFRKLLRMAGNFTYLVTALSLISGFAFTWLSRGNYLENRKEVAGFLKNENMEHSNIIFYAESEDSLDEIQVAELISTVNPRVNLTFKPKDTLNATTLTEHRVLQKIKISKNRYQ